MSKVWHNYIFDYHCRVIATTHTKTLQMSQKDSAPGTEKVVRTFISLPADFYKKLLVIKRKNGFAKVQDIMRVALAEYVKKESL